MKCDLALALALLGRAEGDREGDDEVPESLSGLTLLSSARPLQRRHEGHQACTSPCWLYIAPFMMTT